MSILFLQLSLIIMLTSYEITGITSLQIGYYFAPYLSITYVRKSVSFNYLLDYSLVCYSDKYLVNGRKLFKKSADRNTSQKAGMHQQIGHQRMGPKNGQSLPLWAFLCYQVNR